MKLRHAISVLAASLTIVPEVAASPYVASTSDPLQGKSALESRDLQSVTYSFLEEVDAGTTAFYCQRRYPKIADTRRLATMSCDENYPNNKKIELFDFDDKTQDYYKIFSTKRNSFHGNPNFGFSPDGKTIVMSVNHSCDGYIYYQADNDNVNEFTETPFTFFDCSSSNYYLPGMFQVGTNYDGTLIAIGGGAYTISGSSIHNHGIVKVFEKNSDSSWSEVYQYVGQNHKGHVGYSAVLSRDGRTLLFNDKNGARMCLKYVRRNDDGTWSTPTLVPGATSHSYWIMGYFSSDASRVVVNTSDQGISVLDYDFDGDSMTLVKSFTDSRFNSPDGGTVADISDDGKRIIFCGYGMGTSTVATFDEQSDGSWTTSFWGTSRSWGGCTIDGSGGLLAADTMADNGALKTYRDTTIDLIPMTPAPTSAPTITKAGKNEWFINNIGDKATEEVRSSDTILISLEFNATNKDIGALVFQDDCISPFDNSNYFLAETTSKTSSKPDGYVQFNSTLLVNVTAINGTDYWNEFTDGTRGGWVQACVETYLSFTDELNLGNDEAEQKVDFKNTILNISVSLTATYDIDEVNVAREEADRENVDTDYSKFVVAYQCNAADPYTPATPVNPYNQGDEITICVSDESNGIVQVEEFVNLVVNQDGNTPYNFILGTLYNPDITTPVCLEPTNPSDRRVCYAKIRALARFFQSVSPGDLTISGSVYVIRDGRRVRRNLRMALPAAEKSNEEDQHALAASGRRVEEEEGSGEFEVKVSLGSADDSAASGRIIGSGAAGLMSMAIGAAGVALMA